MKSIAKILLCVVFIFSIFAVMPGMNVARASDADTILRITNPSVLSGSADNVPAGIQAKRVDDYAPPAFMRMRVRQTSSYDTL